MTPPAVLDAIVGQPRAERLLRASVAAPLHAYLFVGPPGTGRLEAAVAFAAALVCPDQGCGTCQVCREVRAGRHPDVVVVEREGASISVEQAREVARLAIRSPRTARRQVLVLVDFHLMAASAPALLKTIEEPPDTTVLILIADSVPVDFVTIASRCVKVEFDPLSEASVVDALVRGGVDGQRARAVASAAHGRLDRARLLAGDPGFAERLALWRDVPARLDGTGATVARLASELLAKVAEPVGVLKARQADDLAALDAEAASLGEKQLPGRVLLEERHKRELRRARTDEMRAGLAMLAASYRARLEPLPGSTRASGSGALKAIAVLDEASERLTRSPNETLLLEWLLLRLDALG